MKLQETQIEEVRNRSDIVEIIGETVRLRPQGKSFVGLCPFHADKHPSMNVNPHMGIFKCFSCGKGGNVITYMMEYYKLPFIEAVKQLASRAGIVLPEEQDSSDNESQNKMETLRAVMLEAQTLYAQMLKNREASLAQAYISKRGFSHEIVQQFSLGYSPDAWKFLCEGLVKKGFKEETLEEAGLIIRKDDGAVYDRFRNRLMFPIHDVAGRTIGFGARQLTDEKGQAKYINSPETGLYSKSRVLYGLYQAKNAIRNQDAAIMTEGYADTITLHQFGFTHTIASSGTALTREQLQLLSRFTKNVFIAYDGDGAGQTATIRGLELALEEGFNVKIMQFPEGEDPDSFIRNRGADAFRSAMLSAQSFLEFRLNALRSDGVLADPPRLAQAIRELIDLIVRIPDTMQHDMLLQQLWDSLRLSEMQLRRMYEEYEVRMKKRNRMPREQRFVSYQKNSSYTESQQMLAEEPIQPMKEVAPEEKELLRLILTNPKVLRFMTKTLEVSPDTMITPFGKTLLLRAIDAMNANVPDMYSAIAEHEKTDDAMRDFLAGIVMKRDAPSINWKNFEVEIPNENQKKIMTDCLFRLRIKNIDKQVSEIKNKISDNLIESDIEILKTITNLTKEKNNLLQQLRSGI
ncbi:MAG TPA: DNA primase [Candidatus Kapabacteria bacterium]|jgi:DNA primase|nr:DNA primase [Candidatus Kapabacteria bacterium]